MSDDVIFREVDDELRSDRMRNLWRTFGPWVIGAAVLIVLLVAANEGWRWYQNSVASDSSQTFYEAFELADDGDLAGAQAKLNESIANGSGDYPALAQFAQASLLAEDGKVDEAIAAYDALAGSVGNAHLRELALIHAASLLSEKADVAGIQSRLAGILSSEGANRNIARELLGLAQYQAGEKLAARQTFEEIVLDPAAAGDVTQRIDVYIAQLTSEGIVLPVEEPDAMVEEGTGE